MTLNISEWENRVDRLGRKQGYWKHGQPYFISREGRYVNDLEHGSWSWYYYPLGDKSPIMISNYYVNGIFEGEKIIYEYEC